MGLVFSLLSPFLFLLSNLYSLSSSQHNIVIELFQTTMKDSAATMPRRILKIHLKSEIRKQNPNISNIIATLALMINFIYKRICSFMARVTFYNSDLEEYYDGNATMNKCVTIILQKTSEQQIYVVMMLMTIIGLPERYTFILVNHGCFAIGSVVEFEDSLS